MGIAAGERTGIGERGKNGYLYLIRFPTKPGIEPGIELLNFNLPFLSANSYEMCVYHFPLDGPYRKQQHSTGHSCYINSQ